MWEVNKAGKGVGKCTGLGSIVVKQGRSRCRGDISARIWKRCEYLTEDAPDRGDGRCKSHAMGAWLSSSRNVRVGHEQAGSRRKWDWNWDGPHSFRLQSTLSPSLRPCIWIKCLPLAWIPKDLLCLGCKLRSLVQSCVTTDIPLAQTVGSLCVLVDRGV